MMTTSKIATSLLTLVLLFAVSSMTARGESVFVALLDAAQEVHDSTSQATGRGTFVLNDEETELSYFIELFGLDVATPVVDPNDVMGLHIHQAPAGSNGGISFGMISPTHDLDDLVIDGTAGTVSGVWEDSDATANVPLSDSLDALRSGDLYVNVHTSGEARGAIRGQILAVPEPTTLSLMATVLAIFAVARRRRTGRA